MYNIWVRTLNKPKTIRDKCSTKPKPFEHFVVLNKEKVQSSWLIVFFWQDDDVDGEHIVAFAEESDPGKMAELLAESFS